ncbi:DUF6078 family protein [Bacteroides sp. 51]|uniref:DUF6078 family protein n=1 Tax=Bacteroides sp. 51 TaxID=2302938 RepID=UPI0013D43240|nr:DUF6078 family protein [Bacteroides sp. 51]NDV81589.1 hypothetical protein [Bacteroides sp. 51]
MKENFDYTQVPYNYVHCLHAQCGRAAGCLRFLVTQQAGSEVRHFSVFNPAHVIGKEEECPHFQEDRMACFALGITHLFDNVPYTKALKIKKMLYFRLKRNTYYRIQRKERQLTPEELSMIREVFRNEGIQEEPAFDELIYKYDW